LIGIISKSNQVEAVEEFFQLFKTPWEFYRPGEAYSVVIATSGELSNVRTKLLLVYGPETKSIDAHVGINRGKLLESSFLVHRDAAIAIYGGACTFSDASSGSPCVKAGTETVGLKIDGSDTSDTTVIRLGYDLFDEVQFLLTSGQPPENASSPALDAHISMLRAWILEEGIPLLEIPPVPAGRNFTVCLTHDIDFIGIRQHKFDHTVLGFLYRSSIGAVRNLVRGRITIGGLFETWRAVASLPFVYLGWAKDFWNPFEWYLTAESGLPATYFLIPFKRRAGERVPGPHASRRATAYDVTDLTDRVAALKKQRCEVGVHGLDAWHSVEKGRTELERISDVTGQSSTGIRVHWLLQDAKTMEVLEKSGFAYDSSAGYNETIGYRNGTTQVFRPLGARTLLELPMHIQDGALFFPQRMDLSESQAQARCQQMIDHTIQSGGVLTLLWHDRSHGPERFWGDFYLRLLQQLKSLNVWFGSAGQVVTWFGRRRDVRFERIQTPDGVRAQLRYNGGEVHPPFRVRVYGCTEGRTDVATSDFVDISWDGKSLEEREMKLRCGPATAVTSPALSQFP
jgi:hypothetical protein